MARAKSSDTDLLGLGAFVSAVGNLVQANNHKQLRALHENLVMRYRQVCRDFQLLKRSNEQLRQEVLELRAQNDRLQKLTKGASA